MPHVHHHIFPKVRLGVFFILIVMSLASLHWLALFLVLSTAVPVLGPGGPFVPPRDMIGARLSGWHPPTRVSVDVLTHVCAALCVSNVVLVRLLAFSCIMSVELPVFVAPRVSAAFLMLLVHCSVFGNCLTWCLRRVSRMRLPWVGAAGRCR